MAKNEIIVRPFLLVNFWCIIFYSVTNSEANLHCIMFYSFHAPGYFIIIISLDES